VDGRGEKAGLEECCSVIMGIRNFYIYSVRLY